jgi:hypothetical protein
MDPLNTDCIHAAYRVHTDLTASAHAVDKVKTHSTQSAHMQCTKYRPTQLNLHTCSVRSTDPLKPICTHAVYEARTHSTHAVYKVRTHLRARTHEMCTVRRPQIAGIRLFLLGLTLCAIK